jgi:hypothetical protein
LAPTIQVIIELQHNLGCSPFGNTAFLSGGHRQRPGWLDILFADQNNNRIVALSQAGIQVLIAALTACKGLPTLWIGHRQQIEPADRQQQRYALLRNQYINSVDLDSVAVSVFLSIHKPATRRVDLESSGSMPAGRGSFSAKSCGSILAKITI